MTKKAKLWAILCIIYLTILSFFLGLIIGFLKSKSLTKILITAGIFLAIAVIGYLLLVLYKIKNVIFVCPNCNKKHKLTFTDYVFAKKVAEGRLIKCSCSEEEILPKTYYIDDNNL